MHADYQRRNSTKHGGDMQRQELTAEFAALPEVCEDILALDEALGKLIASDPGAGELVRLRYFAGLTNEQAAELLGISPRMAFLRWRYDRAWRVQELGQGEG